MPLKKAMPDEVYQKLKDLKPIIMGGAIRAVFTNNKISDYDLYARNDSNYNEIYQFYTICRVNIKKIAMLYLIQITV